MSIICSCLIKKICLSNKFPNWKNTAVLNLIKYWGIYLKWYGKTRVTSYELRIESLEERVEIQMFEFKSGSYEFNFTSYELNSTSSRITKSMKTQLNRHGAPHILISSVKLFDSSRGNS